MKEITLVKGKEKDYLEGEGFKLVSQQEVPDQVILTVSITSFPGGTKWLKTCENKEVTLYFAPLQDIPYLFLRAPIVREFLYVKVTKEGR
jgi:hypothetical protein